MENFVQRRFHGPKVFSQIESPSSSGSDVLDVGDALVFPGLVDAHVHLNEPGRTDWEGFATGTRAAAAGGFTTLVDMPLNCSPVTTSTEALKRSSRPVDHN